jgi:hypothetical protein
MQEFLLILIGVLGVGISVVVKLIFIAMDADK